MHDFHTTESKEREDKWKETERRETQLLAVVSRDPYDLRGGCCGFFQGPRSICIDPIERKHRSVE